MITVPLQLGFFILLHLVPLSSTTRCEIARSKCAFRSDCGIALHTYMFDCADLTAGRTTVCSPQCSRALIALTSTEKGQELINCDCHGSKFCQLHKERVEVCRPSVVQATAEGSNVSCSIARWICSADYQCSAALEYYKTFCWDMFRGRRCSARCNNSLSILNRQEKAAKLRTCYCDGTEDFPCQFVKENTEKLCYNALPSSETTSNDVSDLDSDSYDTDDNENRLDNTIQIFSMAGTASTKSAFSSKTILVILPLIHHLLHS